MSNSVAVLWAFLKGGPVILKSVSSLTFFYVKLKIFLPFKFLSFPSHFGIKLPLRIYRPKWLLFFIQSFFPSFFSQGNINHYLNKLWSDSLSLSIFFPPPSRGAELSMLKFSWIRPHCHTWITVLVWSLMLVLIDWFFSFVFCVDLELCFEEESLLHIQTCSLIHSVVSGYLWTIHQTDSFRTDQFRLSGRAPIHCVSVVRSMLVSGLWISTEQTRTETCWGAFAFWWMASFTPGDVNMWCGDGIWGSGLKSLVKGS